jgi:NAD(P)-dependent dehydrogenase (short-subunit alcohol dehydrogenase family)
MNPPSEGTAVAVITGAASGFGLALAGRCASAGMAVVLLDLDGERAGSEAIALSDAHGVVSLARRVDVADGCST